MKAKVPPGVLFAVGQRKGGGILPLAPRRRKSSPYRHRAVMVGQVWSAELAETLMEVYFHLLKEGYSLEDVSHLVQDLPDDGPGD